MSPTVLSEPLRTFLQGICHQQPQRSFAPADTLLPLCARCTGIWEGALIALLAILLVPSLRSRRPGRIWFGAALAALAVFLAETVGAVATGTSVPNRFRYLVGASGGFFIGVFAVYLHRYLGGEKSTPDTGQELIGLGVVVLALAAAWLTLQTNCTVAWLAHALLTTSGVIAALSAVNFVLMAAAAAAARRVLPTLLHLSVATALSLGEVAVLSFVVR